MLTPLPLADSAKSQAGGVRAKTLRKILKKAHLKTTGRKSTLVKRAKKAKLIKGGADEPKVDEDAVEETKEKVEDEEMEGGRRRKSRKGKSKKSRKSRRGLFF
jgi:hypothetical protein